MRRLPLLVVMIYFGLFSYHAKGACVSASAGAQRYNSSLATMQVCVGTNWQNLGDNISTGDSCTVAEIGKQKYAFDSVLGQNGMIFCSAGGDWMSLMVAPGTAGGCTGAGRQRYVAGTTVAEYCNGTNWYDMRSSAPVVLVVCSTYGTQPACDADQECSWNGASCVDCPCKH